MNLLIITLFFILGSCMGSFYHVVGFRLPKGESIIEPKRSYCPSCGHVLKIGDLVPIFSYIFLFGRCRYCKNKISIFYPAIEFITGLLFAASFKVFGFSYELIVSLTLVSMLSIILVSDINYLIIPDCVTVISMIVLILTSLVMRGLYSTFNSCLYALVVFIMMYLFMLMGNFMFKKESLGGADIKIMLVSGFAVGFVNSLLVLFIASLIALPVSIYLLIKNKEGMIPFGPFLVISMIIVMFLKIDILSILMSW